METMTRLETLQAEVQGVNVGQTILRPRTTPLSERVSDRAIFLKLQENPIKLFSISRRMHNNVAVDAYYGYETERPASAYYTYDPKLDLVILEWGLIQDSGAKLHTYLNEVLDYPRRTLVEGMTLASGHVTKIKNQDTSLALLDRLISERLDPSHPCFRTVQILQQNRYLVMTCEGKLCDTI